MDANHTLEILGNLKLIQHAIRDFTHDYFKSINLTGPQGMLLHTLARSGPMKISDISESMHLSVSTVSGIVDRLENMDYVERIRSKEDRRIVQVYLTGEFRNKMKTKQETLENYMADILSSCTGEEGECIRKGLRLLKELIESKGENSNGQTD